LESPELMSASQPVLGHRHRPQGRKSVSNQGCHSDPFFERETENREGVCFCRSIAVEAKTLYIGTISKTQRT